MAMGRMLKRGLGMAGGLKNQAVTKPQVETQPVMPNKPAARSTQPIARAKPIGVASAKPRAPVGARTRPATGAQIAMDAMSRLKGRKPKGFK